MTRSDCIRELLAEYQNQRTRNELELDARIAEAGARDPEILRLREENTQLAFDTMKRIMVTSDPEACRTTAEQMKQRGLFNNARIRKRLTDLGLPEDYLEQLLGTLRRAGLVTTVRGAQGGYALAKAPEEVTVGHIIDALEGPLSIADCVWDESRCHKAGQCPSRRVWEYLSRSINQLLQSITLRDMLEQTSFDDLDATLTADDPANPGQP